jgi:Family of unknown function (DUF7010)
MLVMDAQREVRTVYLGGFVGQLVSAVLWALSAAAATWVSLRAGILLLVFGGMLIFPLTQMILRLRGRAASLSPENPLRELAMEIAFLVPLLLPLAGAAALHRREWFYPACMIIVGAHYLPFSFLYGLRYFLVLGSVMLATGLLIGMYAPGWAVQGAYLNAALLAAFAFVGRRAVELTTVPRVSAF